MTKYFSKLRSKYKTGLIYSLILKNPTNILRTVACTDNHGILHLHSGETRVINRDQIKKYKSTHNIF